VSQSDGRLLGTAKQGLHELGYTGELVQENYAFADFGAELRVRRIPLAAFGQIPTSFESAWLAARVGIFGSGRWGPKTLSRSAGSVHWAHLNC